MKIRPLFAWYDLWVGAFWDKAALVADAILAATPVQSSWQPIETMTEAEWPKEIDERVLIYVVHSFAQYEPDQDVRLANWEGWHVGYWTDFNGGGWIWHGMLGEVTHVAALLPRPTSPVSSTDRGGK